MTSQGQGKLQGRTVAVTGASKGIGLALVDRLLSEGARVLGGARSVDGLSREGAEFAALDVADEASARAFARRAIDLGADALVNNAGVGVFGPFEEISLRDYRRVMDTNVLGTLLVTKELIGHFRALGAAQVVNVTSDVSDRTFAGGALYTASKFAQRALTRALAYEGQTYGLRVTEIRSGLVDTFFGDTPQGEERKRGWLRPEDVADAAVYALAAPPHARIDELLVHPIEQDVTF